jgi:hypothetical protein
LILTEEELDKIGDRKAVAYPGIFLRGWFNKFIRGQRAERMGIWGW